tara:strand:- start:894 stop:1661 length:768 start_codon:yes stop_codon:yes gene_type:complete
LKFTVDSIELKEALESLQVKGKALSSSGFTSTNIGSYVYMTLTNNSLNLWNGNPTFVVNINLEVEGETDGTVIADGNTILPYLKAFGENAVVSVGDFITITSGQKGASIPVVINHPNMDAIDRLSKMVPHVSYQPQPIALFNFGKSKFEGAFTLTNQQFTSCIKTCELVKSGVYKLDFNEGVPKFSTRQNVQNKYDEVVTPVFVLGEPATIEFSGPLYSFFKKEQLLNFYVKDEFPLLVVAEDRLLIKAPYVNGG